MQLVPIIEERFSKKSGPFDRRSEVEQRNHRRRARLTSSEETSCEVSMNTKQLERTRSRAPVWVALAIAIFGVLAMLLVDHGPWNRPNVQTAEVANYKTTGEAARAVGAQVVPTAPKQEIEPEPPGPKPAQPANPQTP
jgi:hypothetical protein